MFATFYCSIHPISKFLNKDGSRGAQEEKEERGEMRKEKNKLKGMKTLKMRRNKDYSSKSKRNEDGNHGIRRHRVIHIIKAKPSLSDQLLCSRPSPCIKLYMISMQPEYTTQSGHQARIQPHHHRSSTRRSKHQTCKPLLLYLSKLPSQCITRSSIQKSRPLITHSAPYPPHFPILTTPHLPLPPPPPPTSNSPKSLSTISILPKLGNRFWKSLK